jgi:hypothetical protein
MRTSSSGKFFTRFTFILVAIVAAAFMPQASSAAPGARTKKIVRLDRKISKLQRQLGKQFSKLTDAEKASVVSEIGDSSNDADDDGLPNWLEDDDAICNPDHDNDGVEDGDEFDDDEDDDEDEEGAEIEESGLISSLTETTLTINSLVFAITEQTQFLGSKNLPRPRTDFKVGVCVEVEGLVSDVLVATKVKFEDDC